MADAIVCDKCNAIIRDGIRGEQITEIRLKFPRKFRDQHDGDFERRVMYHFDLCDKCAKELYREITREDPDEVII